MKSIRHTQQEGPEHEAGVFVTRSIRSFLVLVSLLAVGSGAQAYSGDTECFPRYRATGAIPGTGLMCEITASTASGNLGVSCTASSAIKPIERYCGTIPKDMGPSCNGIGNPINSGTGNKYQIEADYREAAPASLQLKRYYNSSPSASQGRSSGIAWRTNYDRSIWRIDGTTGTTSAAYRDDGKILYFTLSNAVWEPAVDISAKLIRLADASGGTTGWQYIANDSIETYSAAGKLLSIADRAGRTQTLTYDLPLASGGDDDPETLDTVTDDTGRQLRFSYDASKRIATVTDPAGGIITYGYDAYSTETGQSFHGKLDSRSVATRGFCFYSESCFWVKLFLRFRMDSPVRIS